MSVDLHGFLLAVFITYLIALCLAVWYLATRRACSRCGSSDGYKHRPWPFHQFHAHRCKTAREATHA